MGNPIVIPSARREKVEPKITSDNTWFWQGDGEDHLESITCWVWIDAHQFRAELDKARADERTKTLKEVGEWLDTESYDVKDKLPTWLLVGLANLNRGERPGEPKA